MGVTACCRFYNRSQAEAAWTRKPHFQLLQSSIHCLNEIVRMLRCYIHIRFKLTEVTSHFLYGLATRLVLMKNERTVTEMELWWQCWDFPPSVIWQRAADCVPQCLDCTSESSTKRCDLEWSVIVWRSWEVQKVTNRLSGSWRHSKGMLKLLSFFMRIGSSGLFFSGDWFWTHHLGAEVLHAPVGPTQCSNKHPHTSDDATANHESIRCELCSLALVL